MESWLIEYIVFQIIVYVLAFLSMKGEEIRTGTTDNYFFWFITTTIPAFNALFLFVLFLDENADIKLGFNEYKNVFHYLILALPVLALVSLFFVKI